MKLWDYIVYQSGKAYFFKYGENKPVFDCPSISSDYVKFKNLWVEIVTQFK